MLCSCCQESGEKSVSDVYGLVSMFVRSWVCIRAKKWRVFVYHAITVFREDQWGEESGGTRSLEECLCIECLQWARALVGTFKVSLNLSSNNVS